MTETPYSRLDQALAVFLSQRATLPDEQKPAFEKLVREVSFQQTQGHNCIEVDENSQGVLSASGLVARAESPERLPLVLEKNRLYLHRYWSYEDYLARTIKRLLGRSHAIAAIEAALDRYFTPSTEIDWQREAAKIAISQSFSMITGGPGTGKTTTVVKILALLQEWAAEPLHIALTAPTGKAAMRLQESIGASKANLPCDEIIKQHIPEQVTTLHRLLGAMPPSPYFRHHADNPLSYDVVVVDEASMVDLALMAKLLDALKPDARLILLGDKDQLASVESGAVLNDLTVALPTHTVELKKSHRFGGVIKELAVAVNEQQPKQAWQTIQKTPQTVSLLVEDLIAYIAKQQHGYLKMVQAGADFVDIYRTFNQFQVLCANQQGKLGVKDINYRVEQQLLAGRYIRLPGLWYTGRPVMVRENHPALHLYNGDIGLCLPDVVQQGKLMVFFQDASGQVKKYLPSRLPVCDTVFAMTIHKSQGSEFDEVLIILPEVMNPVLTKELLYTGITRARKTVRLASSQAVFMGTVTRKIERVTGLLDKFRQVL